MKDTFHTAPLLPDQPRRKFSHRLTAGGIALGLAPWTILLATPKFFGATPILSGLEFDLTIGKPPVNFSGKPRLVQGGPIGCLLLAHAHPGFQEQEGMFGAIVIEPAAGDPVQADHDHVIMLSDWIDEDPMHIYKKLKMQRAYYCLREELTSLILFPIGTRYSFTSLYLY